MKTIAVIEDNPDNRLLVRAILEDRFAVREYENGFDGLTGVRAEPPDLLLLDISLPEIDGTEVLAELRKDEQLGRLPIVALTAHAMSGDREKYLAMGFDAYLTKPIVDEEILLSTIDRLLAGA